MCFAASLIIWFGVDVEKGRRDAVRFAEAHRVAGGSHIVGVGQVPMDAEPSAESADVDVSMKGDVVKDTLITVVKA